MMNMESAMHQRNLESSILFMQQEHAATLKGLHEEIAVLQKKCTDLTFQLTMNGLTIDESSAVDSKVSQVHQELESSRARISALEKELADRDKRIERLESEARSQRKRWLDDSRTQTQITNSLRAELEAKANNVAYLTTELHRLKQKSRVEGAVAVNNGNSGAPSQPGYLHPDSAQSGKKTQTHHHYIPAPPTRDKTLGPGSAVSRLRRSGHNRSSTLGVSGSGKPLTGVHPSSADAVMGRQTNPLRLSSGRSSGSESPDITPFVQPTRDEVQVVGVKQGPKVLPPIGIGSSVSMGGGGTHPVLVHQVVSSTSQKTSPPKPTDAAIVTLAVGNAAAPDSAWALAQKSPGSEYN